jgi:ACS family tartrate transporter-like MFS transporter
MRDLDQKTRVSFRWRVVLPMIMIMYILAYLDRTNISFALTGMQKEFAFSSTVSGFISGIFFFGYLLLQLPAGHLASHKSAKRNVLILGILFGILSSLQGFTTGKGSLMVVRFLLGVAEGGMFPSMYVLIANWFPEKERGRATSLFTLYQTVAPLIMSPISGIIVSSVTWWGLPGWRWVFPLEGIPSLIWAIIFYFIVPDSPKVTSSQRITEQERSFLLKELEEEAKKPKVVSDRSYWKGARNPSFILFTLSFTAVVIGNYGIGIWLPVIIKGISNYGYTAVGFISALPWLVATIAMVLIGYINDRWGNKKAIIFWLEMVSGICFLFVTFIGTSNLWLSVFFISIATIGLTSAPSVYFTMLPELLSKEMLGGLTGVFAAVGNIGGFIGPFVVGALMSGGDKLGGMLFLSSMLFLAGILIVFVKMQNRKNVAATVLKQPAKEL